MQEPQSSTPPPSPKFSPSPNVELQPSPKKKPSKSTKLFRQVKSVFRSFPIITPTACKFPVSLAHLHDSNHIHGGTRMTGTLFGYRKSRINLAIQENPRCVPMLILELSIITGKLLQEMRLGLVRIALECEKQSDEAAKKTQLMDEPYWTLYCNGRRAGYGSKREAREEDLNIMQLLRAMSIGAGVLPSEKPEGELTYMRAYFERVTASKDSETYYMMNPDGNSGPELSIFFVRI